MNVSFAPSRGTTLERALELAEECGAEVTRGDLFITGLPSAINAFAGALEKAGFELGAPMRRGRGLVVEKLARRDQLVIHLRTV